MSAPVPAGVLRELGAKPMQFHSVKAAYRWHRKYQARQTNLTPSLFRGGAPSSQESREQSRATYAQLLCVFRYRDERSDEENLRWSLGVTLDWLSGEYSDSYLQTRAGIRTPEGFSRYVGRVEKILLERLNVRGMFHERDGEGEDAGELLAQIFGEGAIDGE